MAVAAAAARFSAAAAKRESSNRRPLLLLLLLASPLLLMLLAATLLLSASPGRFLDAARIGDEQEPKLATTMVDEQEQQLKATTVDEQEQQEEHRQLQDQRQQMGMEEEEHQQDEQEEQDDAEDDDDGQQQEQRHKHLQHEQEEEQQQVQEQEQDEQQQQQQQQGFQEHIFLGAVIFNRVFEADKFNITGYECAQWIEFMLYAGVEHVYWYDTAHSDAESQESTLRAYVDQGKLTYHRFYHLFPPLPGADFHYEQDNSYRHFLANYNSTMDWVVEMDVDEYPFAPSDTEPGFLSRYLRSSKVGSSVSQVLLQCFIFAGNPVNGAKTKKLLVERYTRRNPSGEGVAPQGFGSRQKPVLRPAMCAGVAASDPHNFPMRSGATMVAQEDELRMNHYWGPRETNFGPDTPAVTARLRADTGMLPIAARIRSASPLLRSLARLSRS